jgi:hypothetical protein
MNKTEAYNCRKRSNGVANDVARIVKILNIQVGIWHYYIESDLDR